MTPERDFHYTLIKYLDIKGKQELSNIIKRSRIVYDKLWPFSGVVSYQRKMNINIKTPIEFKTLLEKEIDLLRTLSFEIYEDDDEYMATDVVITVLVIISHHQAHLFAWMSLSISNWSPSIRTLGPLKKPRLVANVACMGI